MIKQLRKIITLTLALAITMCISSSISDMASYIDSGAKILRVEYQGKELSRDRQAPTVFNWTGNSIVLDLIGNPACALLNDVSDIGINSLTGDYNCTRGYSAFNDSAKADVYIDHPAYMYVGNYNGNENGNDVFEIYWSISCVIQRSGDTAKFDLIPNSESPKYYIAYNAGEINHVMPQGSIPTIVRAELNNVELSKDKNHPTQIPFFNSIKLIMKTQIAQAF